jgi:hypothetical protein
MNRKLVLRRTQRRSLPTIQRRPPGAVAPASFGQEQIWLHSQLAPELPLYVESLTIRRRGVLDSGVLVAAFRHIARRHEIWRTTFHWAQGQLIQHVHADKEPVIQVTDLRDLPEPARETSAIELAAEDLRRPFDLSRELGVRAHLVTLSDTDHRLYLCLHHLVFDGISIYRVFLPELVSLCEAAGTGADSVLEDLPLQYGDFACWERQSVQETSQESLISYWQAALAGAPRLSTLPSDRPRLPTQSFRGQLVRFQFPPELTAAVRSAASQENCTVFMFLLTAFALTLSHRAGQTDLVLGSVSGGRDRPELERLIGYFLRILIIRIDLGGTPSFRDLLGRVREALLEALSHDALPFQRLIHRIAPERNLSYSPLFQVTFSMEPPLPPLGPSWDLSEMDGGTVVSKFDLSIELEDRGEAIIGRAIYDRDLFDPSTIHNFLSDWTAELRGQLALSE